MEHRLSCYFSIILKYIISVTTKDFCHRSHNLLCHNKDFGSKFFWQFIKICIMFFRNNKRMPLGSRTQIQNYNKLVIFIKFSAGNFSICNFTKNTIVFFHN